MTAPISALPTRYKEDTMIKMTKGTYCHKDGNVYVDITPADGPVSLSKAKEAELVKKGCAEYVDDSTKPAESATAGKGKKPKEAAGEP